MTNGIGNELHIQRVVANDPIWATRGRAIQSYAVLEQWLCRLFAEVSGMNGKSAAIVFFKINNKRAISEILAKLIRIKYDSNYSIFWNSYLKQLRTIDNKRNDIVHWIVQHEVQTRSGEILELKVNLVPPHLWGDEPEEPSNSSSDLQEFIAKCNVFSTLCRQFLLEIAHRRGAPKLLWNDVFRQPLVFPLPSDHPLFRSGQTEQAQQP